MASKKMTVSPREVLQAQSGCLPIGRPASLEARLHLWIDELVRMEDKGWVEGEDDDRFPGF